MHKVLHSEDLIMFVRGLNGRTECIHRHPKLEGWLFCCFHNATIAGELGTPVIYFRESEFKAVSRMVG